MKTILVVEKEEVLRDSIAMFLSLKGDFNIITAVNGFDAFNAIVKRMFKGMSVDLLITDIDIPYLSGLEMLYKLNSININLPVIAVSSEISEDLEIDLLWKGCSHVIEKPFAPDDLITHINALLNNGNGKLELGEITESGKELFNLKPLEV